MKYSNKIHKERQPQSFSFKRRISKFPDHQQANKFPEFIIPIFSKFIKDIFCKSDARCVYALNGTVRQAVAALATDRNAYFTYEPSSRLSGTVRRNEARWNEADDRRGRGRRRRWCVRRTRLELGFGLSERTGGWITKHPLFLRFNAIDRVLSCARFRSRDVSVRPRTKSLILHTFSAMINRIAAFSCIRRSFYLLYFIKNVHLSYFRVLFFFKYTFGNICATFDFQNYGNYTYLWNYL